MDLNDKKRDERNLLARQIFKDACGQAMASGMLPAKIDGVKEFATTAFDCANIFMMVQDEKGKA